MATDQHATTEELLEVVFYVVRNEAVAMQWRRKQVSVANESRYGDRTAVFSVAPC
jgi:hypothetical protein